jgi:small-conductance mechanosensitive channel
MAAAMDFLDEVYYGNSVQAYIVAAGIAVVAFTIATIVRLIVVRRLRGVVEETHTRLDDIVYELVKKTRFWVIVILSMYLGSLALELDYDRTRIYRTIAVAALTLQGGIWVTSAINAALAEYRRRKEDEGNTSSVGAVTLIALVGRFFTWVIVALVILDNLGVDVTTLVAGLGIGGVAFALAIKNILSDLLSSVTIMLDRPFEVGDYIVVGDSGGTVENIGIRSTRLRASSGEQLVFGNDDLLTSRIRNMKRMEDRRAVLTLRVGYDTPPDKIERIPDMVQRIVENRDQVRFDRAHITSLGDSALVVEGIYYLTDPDYQLFLDTQQAVNLEIIRAFERNGIEWALPAQTVHVNKA